MKNEENSQATLAVLIDADNARPSIVDGLLSEVAKYGVASVKRIYGDWTTPQLGGWKSVLLEHSIHPVQQFRYTTGKNATDSSMIIDAMDLLFTGRFDGFCLVSSDSDFTRLASRIREEGLRVYGFGENKAPRAFVSACDKFIYTEVLASVGAEPPVAKKTARDLRSDPRLVNVFRAAIDATSDDDGWAQLGVIGNHIANQMPDFDPRNYGFKKLSELASNISLFEVERRAKNIVIRAKRGK
jgi:NYN domain/OST-HTH/LOTUS domain